MLLIMQILMSTLMNAFIRMALSSFNNLIYFTENFPLLSITFHYFPLLSITFHYFPLRSMISQVFFFNKGNTYIFVATCFYDKGASTVLKSWKLVESDLPTTPFLAVIQECTRLPRLSFKVRISYVQLFTQSHVQLFEVWSLSKLALFMPGLSVVVL